jgi:hypothetical protein
MGLISIDLNLGFGSKRKPGEMHVPHHAAHAAARGPCKLHHIHSFSQIEPSSAIAMRVIVKS